MDWVDGRSIHRLIHGVDEPIREAAFTENALSKAVRFDRYRLTYYPEGLFDEPCPGELYDLEADPHETTNLFDDPRHAAVRDRGMRLILDWLAKSRRVVTSQPTLYDGRPIDGKHAYHLAEDGRAPADQQPHRRTQQPMCCFYL